MASGSRDQGLAAELSFWDRLLQGINAQPHVSYMAYSFEAANRFL
jgi:hypothetical protein